MFKYIYSRYGHKAEALSQKQLLLMLVSDGVPNNAAVTMIAQSERICRQQMTITQLSRGELAMFQCTINHELRVEYTPDPPRIDSPAPIVQTVESAQELADTGKFMAMVDASLSDDDTATRRQVLDGAG